MNGKLPVKWTRQSVTLGAQTFPSKESFPALIYPNPLNLAKYVVLNTGLTITFEPLVFRCPASQASFRTRLLHSSFIRHEDIALGLFRSVSLAKEQGNWLRAENELLASK